MVSLKELFSAPKFVVPDATSPIKIIPEGPTTPRPDLAAAKLANTPRAVNPSIIGSFTLPESKQIPVLIPEEIALPDTETLPAPVLEEEIMVVPQESKILQASSEEISQKLGESPTRAIFDMVLGDVANLVRTGKDLEKLNQLREGEGSESRVEDAIIQDVEIANEKLTQEISRLLNPASNKDLDVEFKTVKESYLNAYEALEVLAGKLKDRGRLSDNKLVLQINTRKQEINKILKEMGGKEIFEKIKDYVKKSELVQARYEARTGATGFAKQVSNSIYSFLNESPADLSVIQGMMTSGKKDSLIDIITLMATTKTDLFKTSKK